MDNKCKRRKFLKSEEVKIYERSQRTKGDAQKRLNNMGYPSGFVIGYGEDITTMGW